MPGEYFMVTGSNGRKYRVRANDAEHARHVEQEINASIAIGDDDLKTLRQNRGYKVSLPQNRQQQAPYRPSVPTMKGQPTFKPKSDLAGLAANGATFGLGDEAAGVAGVLYTLAKAPFSSDVSLSDIPAAYRHWRDSDRANQAKTRQDNPNLAPTLEIAGSLGGTAPGRVAKGLFSGPRTLFQSVKAGAKGGAAMGAAAGYGYGEGLDGSAGGAALGAAGGAALGAALPVGVEAARRTIGAGARFVKPDNGVGRQLVLQAMRDDGLVPSQAGQAIQQAQQRGVPAMIADQGDNLRGLTGSVSRRPGPARTLARNAITERQAGQTERVRGHIVKNLGQVANVAEQSDNLIQQARTAAAPHYDKVYGQPGRESEELKSLLQTPAGKAALNKARSIAANERMDPNKLGFDLDENGETILTNVASPRTLDYVKRGLDDVLEPYRNPMTRKLDLDEAGRAIAGVKGQFVKEVDRLHPGYAEARAAYQGPARERDALNLGQQALNASAEEVQRMTANMTPSELQQFALGHRSAMAQAIDKRVDGADKASALLGTPQKRKALGQVHSGADYDRFLQTMADERMGNETYRTVATGSPTAERLAADGATDDSALLQDLAGRAIKGASNGGITGMAAEAFHAMRDVGRFGAGKAGERAREDAAALLTETDPEALRGAIQEAMRQDLIRRMRQRGIYGKEAGAGLIGGRALGAFGGYGMRPPEESGY